MEDASSEEELHDIDWEDASPFFEYDDPHITSPQITAVLQNDTQHLKALLKAGKSPNIIDNNGNTPLHIAILKDKEEVFDYLLTVKDVRINVRNFEGVTPLMLAVMNLQEGYVKKLIQKRADVNISLPNGDSPLHFTIGKSLPLAVILIESNANINCQNCVDETPIFMACEKREWDFLYMLLYYGADTMICNDIGISPFILCLQGAPSEVQEILFNYNFDEIKCEVELQLLGEIMKANSPFFHQIVEKTSHILYTEKDMKDFSDNLRFFKANMLKILLDKFPKFGDDLFDLCNILLNLYLFPNDLATTNLMECFYTLCESRFIEPIMDKCMPSCGLLIPGAGFLVPLFHEKLPEVTITEFVCCLLSYGLPLHCNELDEAYKCYGFGILFKILLHMDIVDYGLHKSTGNFCRNLIPRVIYDINVDFKDFLKIPKEFLTDAEVKHIRKFFMLERNISVPSLQELGRESTRKNIIESYQIKNNVQFFTVLKHLHLGNIYYAILTYEKEIYQ